MPKGEALLACALAAAFGGVVPVAACTPPESPQRPAPMARTPSSAATLDAGMPAAFAFTDVQVTGDRSCATGNDGRAYRWGEGLAPRPVEVPGLRAITSTHCLGDIVCGLDKYGAITCVGRERRGAQKEDAYAPEKITGLPPASSFVMTKEGGCAITSGDLWCWRHARFTDDDFPVVEPVEGVHDVRTMHESYEGYTCVTRAKGAPLCISPYPEPRRSIKGEKIGTPVAGADGGLPPLARTVVELTKFADAVDVLPGEERDHGVCVILPNGSTDCDVEIPRITLQRAVGNARAVAFFPSSGASPCVKLDTGEARCVQDYFGRSPLTGIAETLGHPTAISIDSGHGCALGKDGLSCWGQASHGQLGDGTPYEHARPAKVPGITDAVRLSVGPELSCVVHKDGALSCWGAWEDSRSVSARATDTFAPVRVPAPFAASNVFVGSRLSKILCATGPAGPSCLFGADWLPITVPRAKVKSVINGAVVTEDNRAFGFGWEGGRAVTEPDDFDKAGIRIASLAPDDFCGVTPDGDVVCGHCGACNAAEAKRVMTRIHGTSRFVEVASVMSPSNAMNDTVCARTVMGTVECYTGSDLPWNHSADLKRTWETELAGVRDVVQISAHGGRYQDNLFCALDKLGAVRCLGDDNHGQRGARQKGPADPMTPVMDLPPVVEIGTASDHACARTAAGDVYCWGSNARGGAPDGAPGFRSAPVKVMLPTR